MPSQNDKDNTKRSKTRALNFFDNWFVPMAFGVFTVFVGVQAAAQLPGVQNAIDNVEGRFVAVQAAVPEKALQKDEAMVTLTADTQNAPTGIEVFLNGKSLGAFESNQMRITVHEGDQISFVDHAGSQVDITVDTDNENLLTPAPGQVIALSPQSEAAKLPAAKFM